MAPRKTLLLALTSTTALVAWQPAKAACTDMGGESYQCSGTGQTFRLPVGANAIVDVAADTTATGDTSNPMFEYSGSGQLVVGQGAQLDAAGQSVMSSVMNNSGILSRVDNAGTLQGNNTVLAGGGLILTNSATGTITGTGTAIRWNRFGNVANDGTVQGAIQGYEGELTNQGTITGNTELFYAGITNSGTMNGAVRGLGVVSVYNSGTITGNIRVDTGGWNYGITNTSTGTLGAGLDLTGLAFITNSGIINGLIKTGGAGTLDNYGTITDAVEMVVNGAGGTRQQQSVYNTGTLQSTLYARGDTTVDNRGTIAGAITLDTGANQYTVTNSGRMGSDLRISSAATVDNSGTIAGPVNLDSTSAEYSVTNSGTLANGVSSSGRRINLTNGATGTITGTANAIRWDRFGQVVNDGVIQGAIQGYEGELTNRGTITGNTELFYAGITNSGTMDGTVRGMGEVSVLNSGTITGLIRVSGMGQWGYGITNTNTGTMASGLDLTGLVNISNSGTISGPIKTGGAATLNNYGTVTGAVEMEVNGAGGMVRQQSVYNTGTLLSTLYARGDTTVDNRGTIAGAVTLDTGANQYTVTNSGRMGSDLRISSAATVDNSGTIAGRVNLDSTSVEYSVTNSGTIADGVYSSGINIALTNSATGTVTGTANALRWDRFGQVVNDGVIQGAITGYEGTVNNRGTITGNTELTAANITNSGTMNGAIRGLDVVGVYNSGLITGNIKMDSGRLSYGITNTSTGTLGSGLDLAGRANVSNSGTINGFIKISGTAVFDNYGTISDAVEMVVVEDVVLQHNVYNAGTLQSTLYARGDTTLDNRGTIVGAVTLDTGANQYTVTNSGRMGSDLRISSAATVTNSGTIAGGLNLDDGSAAYTLTNSGTIGDAVTSVGRMVALVNSGTIQGPIQLYGYDDVVTVRTGAVFGSMVSGGGGSDTLQFEGSGALNLSDGTGSRFRDFERVQVHGGADWTLNGAIAAPLSVNGASVRGGASFGNIDVTNGTLAPGSNGSGAMTANGNVWLGPGSVLLIEINGASNSMLRATGNVTMGGSLSVVGTLQKGQYVLVDAGSLDGAFESVRLAAGNWIQTLDQSGSQLVLTVAAPPALTAGGVASALEGLRGTTSGELSQVLTAISLMPAPEQARAVASLTPERQAGTPAVMVNTTNFFQGALQNRVAQVGGTPRGTGAAPIQLAMAGGGLEALGDSLLHAGQGRWSDNGASGVWIAPWGGVARQKESAATTGWNSSSGGIAVGADTDMGKDMLAGAAFGWGGTSVSYGGAGGDSDNESYLASFYAAWTPGQWTVDTSLTGALSRFDTSRSVQAGTEKRTARSDYSGHTVSAALGGKRLFETGGLEVSPDLRATASRWWLDGYSETGAGSLNLEVDGRSGNRLRAETGVELAHSALVEAGRLRPWVRLAMANDWSSGNRAMQARFAGTASGFAVVGEDDDGFRWLPGAGVSFDLSDTLEASLEYQGELRHDFQAHTGQMALRYKF